MKEIYEKCFATRLTNSLDGKDHPLMYSWKPSFSKIKGHGVVASLEAPSWPISLFPVAVL